MRTEVEKQWKKANSLVCLGALVVPQNPFTDSRERTRSHRGSSVTHTKSTGKGVSAYTDACTAAYQMLTEAFTNCKNEANSLVGLGLRECLLRLSDLCCHALLGRHRHPGNYSDVSFSWALFFFIQLTFTYYMVSTLVLFSFFIVSLHYSCNKINRKDRFRRYFLQLRHTWQVQYIPSLLCLLSAGPAYQPVGEKKQLRLHDISELCWTGL